MIRKPNPNWFENFRKVQKEGELMCAWCYVVFTHDGYPSPTSWICSEYCFKLHNIWNPVITQDTPSRLYLMSDLSNFINLLEPTQYFETFKKEVKNEEKK